MDFPRTVFKSPGKIKWGKDKSYDAVLVKDEKEMDSYIKKGYTDDLNAAIFNPKTENEQPTWKELAIECGLEGEELKKFMKKNTEQKKKQLEKLKEG